MNMLIAIVTQAWSSTLQNLVETAKAGQALPFKNVDEFKDYVIKKMNPKFIDNAGWDAKVEWEIEDPELFEQSKENPWAKDYVLIANLKSGVDDKNYKWCWVWLMWKFVYRVEATDNTNYIELDKAKEAFAKINELRKAQGLKRIDLVRWCLQLTCLAKSPYYFTSVR